MVTSNPSWNTDQGVKVLYECLGIKPAYVIKVNVGKSFGALSTDPDIFG